MTKIEALELALLNVRNYNDRMYLQFLINVERRKDEKSLMPVRAAQYEGDPSH